MSLFLVSLSYEQLTSVGVINGKVAHSESRYVTHVVQEQPKVDVRRTVDPLPKYQICLGNID